MNSTVGICTLIAWGAVWLVLIVAAPWTISDGNAFFKAFVNQEFLNFMGIVVTITLASAANLYIELNKLEEMADKAVFRKTKRSVKTSAFTLVWALIGSILLVVTKPLFVAGDRPEAIINGIAITIMTVSALILLDLTQAAFSLDIKD